MANQLSFMKGGVNCPKMIRSGFLLLLLLEERFFKMSNFIFVLSHALLQRGVDIPKEVTGSQPSNHVPKDQSQSIDQQHPIFLFDRCIDLKSDGYSWIHTSFSEGKSEVTTKSTSCQPAALSNRADT